MKDATLYLLHIRECTDRITRYTHGGKKAFLADEMIQDAVLHNLQILAESTQRLDEDLKANHPEIDWLGFPGLEISLCTSTSASIPCVSGTSSNNIFPSLRGQSPGCWKRSEMNKPSPTTRGMPGNASSTRTRSAVP